MKKLALWSLKQALNKLTLIAFVLANVSPALAQSNMGTSSTFIPFSPNSLSNPALIMEAQANINIYGQQGNQIGQLPAGAIFQTQMANDPFHYVMSQPTLNYPSIFGTAQQV